MDYSKLTVMKLRDMLRKFGLPIYGRKVDLVNRLQETSKFLQSNGITRELVIVLNRIDSSKQMLKSSQSNKRTSPKRYSHRLQKLTATIVRKTALTTHDSVQIQTNKTSKNTRQESVIDKLISTSWTTPKSTKKRHIDDTPVTHTLRPKIRRIDTKEPTTSLHPLYNLQKKKEKTERPNRKVVANIITLKPALEQFEIVWAHIRGYALWPGIIEDQCTNGKYKIHFFGDYSISYVTKYKIVHYMEGFTSYSNYNRTNLLLHKAVRETQIFLFEKELPKCCYICKVLQIRQNF